jgi:hypothetical protein
MLTNRNFCHEIYTENELRRINADRKLLARGFVTPVPINGAGEKCFRNAVIGAFADGRTRLA